MGWFDDDYIRNSPVGAVHSPEGWISAFANIVPEYQANEVNIDLMRRRKNAENGTMEFLFISLFEWARAQGSQGFNLGLSSLSGVGEQPKDPAAERLMHFVLRAYQPVLQFQGIAFVQRKVSSPLVAALPVYPSAANCHRPGWRWWRLIPEPPIF